MNDRQWDELITSINSRNCILILGPAAICVKQNGDRKPLLQLFARHLAEELESEEVILPETMKDDMTYLAQKCVHTYEDFFINPTHLAKKFYERYINHLDEELNLLAKLPFHLIINTTPDALIWNALKREGKYKSKHLYYNFKKASKQGEITDFNEKQPLIYNLFGHYTSPESLVLTEGDRIRFISNVIKRNPPIPLSILSEFDDSKTYLLLGFDYEQWYLKLLMDSLNLGKSKFGSYSPKRGTNISIFNSEFYKKQYKIRFINHDIPSFISDLKEKYSDNYSGLNPSDQPLKGLVFSAREDEKFKEQFLKSVKPIESAGYLEIQSYQDILPGNHITEELNRLIESTNFIFLLVSSDFLVDGTYVRIVKPYLSNQRNTNQIVVNILLRPCVWEEELIGSTNWILPDNGQFINSPSWENADVPFSLIGKAIKDKSIELLKL